MATLLIASVAPPFLRVVYGQLRLSRNIKHFRQQLEAGVAPARRATLLRLLVEEENNLGLTREHLYLLDHQISRLSEIMARQMDLIDNIRSLGQSAERAQMVLATMNELMATYIAHRQKVSAALA